MPSEQYVEGIIKECKREKCKCGCCNDEVVMEWVNEYFAFHERMKDHLISVGIKIDFQGDRVYFKNCSDGQECKFLKHSLNKDIDSRPIDCKIYPFMVDWENIDFDKKVVSLYYWDNECPLVRENKIPPEFKKEAENIIKRDFALLFYGARFTVKFIDKVYED